MTTSLTPGALLKFSRRALSALVVCLVVTSTPAAGQTPPSPGPTPSLTISGPASIPPYTLGQYAVTGDSTAKVAWMVLPNTSQVVVGQTLVLTGQPSTYTVIAFAVVAGQPVILQQAVTIAGPTPAPTPTPTPTPTPAPTPAPTTTGPYYVAFVSDAASTTPLTAGQASLRASTTMQGSLKALAFGNQWAPNVDVSSPTFPYGAPARKAGLPCVMIVGTNAAGLGFVVEAIANPTDEASVLAEIQRLAAGGVPKTAMRRSQKKATPEPVIPLWVDAGPSNNWFGYGSEKAFRYAAQTAIPAGD